MHLDLHAGPDHSDGEVAPLRELGATVLPEIKEPGTDATLAGVAESRHGAGAGAGTMVYLHLDAGVGGAVVEAGRAIRGTTGAAGEFGHMPFGDPARRCRCGARGCWNTSLDGQALARLLHQRVPADDVGYLRRVLASARAGEPGALSAIRTVASSIGRGVAGLVNGLDPHLAPRKPSSSSRKGLETLQGSWLSGPCDPADFASIAEALVAGVAPDRDRLRDMGFRRAGEFTWAAAAASTLDVYREVAERRRRRRA